ncbi:MAG: alginate lyase family protein, partial [Candidatus Aenigmarchaeota archaeon]|nr:alginate lyase family protein [Candidatus Aenigmarchaeota archaeon]
FLGLCYAIEGNAECLNKAKKLLVEWAETNEPTGNPIDETNLEGFIFAYDFIKQGINEKEKSIILDWFLKIQNKQSEWKFGATSGVNNWKTHNIKMLLMLDKILGDEVSFKKHIKDAEKHYKANIDKSSGKSYDYEQRNSLKYHTYNLEPWLEIALLSKDFEHKIKPAFNFLAKQIKEGNIHNQFIGSKVKTDLKRGENGFGYGLPGSVFDITRISRAVYSYYALFPEEKDNELIKIADKKPSAKNDFFKLRTLLYE